MMRLLVLRPEPGASATVARAKERGLDPCAIPLFVVEAVEWQAPELADFDGLLLTSANALRHGGEQLQALRGLKVYAVGESTAQAARDSGFDIASTGDSSADRLLGSIESDRRLLHLCGADRRAPDSATQEITPVVVYRAREIDNVDLSQAPGTVALVHSPRAGARFAELVSDRSSISIAAISQAAAESVGAGWKRVEAAAEPRDDVLLALAARLCNNSRPK